MNYYGDQFPETEPFDTEDGISTGAGVRNWWAVRWLNMLEGMVNAGRLRRGKNYAQSGQILTLETRDSGVFAEVLGTRQPPYEVTLRIEPLSSAQWDSIFDALKAERARYSAQLLAGDLPREIEDVFAAAGASLFPDNETFTAECTCPDWARPCKHAVAVSHVVAERLDGNPLLLFRWRGRPPEQVLIALGVDAAERNPVERRTVNDVETVPPLAETLEQFWELGAALDTFQVNVEPPATDFAVLKRLGQPDFIEEDITLVLGLTYINVSEQALEIAYSDETRNPDSEEPTA